jgi:hypothetical protein
MRGRTPSPAPPDLSRSFKLFRGRLICRRSLPLVRRGHPRLVVHMSIRFEAPTAGAIRLRVGNKLGAWTVLSRLNDVR